ncbi:ATP-dependent DNA helicase, partial [Tremellales sp. Uapishka_1]
MPSAIQTPDTPLPSLANSTIGGTSTSNSMPASPRTASPIGDRVKDEKPQAIDVNVVEAGSVEEEDDPELTIADSFVLSLVPSAIPIRPSTFYRSFATMFVELDDQAKARSARLNFLLNKSTIYAQVIGDRMERQQIEKAQAEARAATRKANKEKKDSEMEAGSRREGMRRKDKEEVGSKRKRESAGGRGKRAKVENVKPAVEDESGLLPSKDGEEVEQEKQGDLDTDPVDEKQYSFAQPSLVTGATLRDYQLAGVQWMISLYENGLNGILADEMGLGKTLQTISFLAHLKSKGTWGPFLIVCPLSVLHNWITEFEKFTPDIPVLMYHGSPEHRATLRATRMQAPAASGVGNVKKGRKSTGTSDRLEKNSTATFPIIVTTYEMCIKDRQHLSGFKWKFIVVDEGHRLKNLDCKLIRELKTYTSANRLILTGTPLHNNLAELWSLLNFILPDIFDDLDSFQQWFNFDDMHTAGDSGLLNKQSVVTSLHAILKPFLLRRLKVDVEKDLPPKKEYLLYAPLTVQQKDIYQAIVSRQIRQFLIDKKTESDSPKAAIEEEVEEETGRSTRKQARLSYRIEENDSKYIRDLEDGVDQNEPSGVPEKSAAQVGRDWAVQKANKTVNNMKLQNIVMQLRKISSHPFLFDWPSDASGQLVVNDDLVNASGKMLLLNRLLDELFKRGHKVLLFSQFTTMLDVIEDWATSYKGWEICRIDGSTSQESRREQMNTFNNGGQAKGACKLFLLSTRAGGLGINLVSADTVIFFDQDWNPQMDLQAQDRAHRIGQTKPVLIFRLVSAHTIETKILQKAGNKRKLEALVISQGKFGKVVDENGKILLGRGKQKHESTAEMAKALLNLEGEEINIVSAGDTIISDVDLDILLDRSPAAFAREKGWSAGLGKTGAIGRDEQIKKGEKTAFEVFVPAKDEAADGLANMFGGDGEAEEA